MVTDAGGMQLGALKGALIGGSLNVGQRIGQAAAGSGESAGVAEAVKRQKMIDVALAELENQRKGRGKEEKQRLGFYKSFSKHTGITFGTANMLRQSQIFTSSVGAMFQLIGATLDILLAPLIPLLVPAFRLWVKWMIPLAFKVGAWIKGIVDWISSVMKDPVEGMWDLISKRGAGEWNKIFGDKSKVAEAAKNTVVDNWTDMGPSLPPVVVDGLKAAGEGLGGIDWVALGVSFENWTSLIDGWVVAHDGPNTAIIQALMPNRSRPGLPKHLITPPTKAGMLDFDEYANMLMQSGYNPEEKFPWYMPHFTEGKTWTKMGIPTGGASNNGRPLEGGSMETALNQLTVALNRNTSSLDSINLLEGSDIDFMNPGGH